MLTTFVVFMAGFHVGVFVMALLSIGKDTRVEQ